MTYTLPPIPPLPPYPPYPVVVSIPAFHPFPQTRDIVHQDRVIDSVTNTSTHPDHPPPPPQACALDVLAHTQPFPPLRLIVHHVILTVRAMNIILPQDHPPPPPFHPEFPDPPLAPALVGLSTFTLIPVVPVNIPDTIWFVSEFDIPMYAVLAPADHPTRTKLPHAHPAHEESVMVIAVLIIAPLLLPGLVTVEFAPVLPPAPPAPPVNHDAFEPLFCIVPPDTVSVQETNTLNHAVLNVAPPDTVRSV